MNRAYPSFPRIGVGAIVIDEGRVLLVKRANPPLAGEWSIPGGLLEIGETMRECAVREGLEETGLVVETREMLGVFDRVLLDSRGKVEYHYVLVDFLCRLVRSENRGDVRASGDAAEARWFTQEDIAALPLMKDTAEVINLAFEKAALIG